MIQGYKNFIKNGFTPTLSYVISDGDKEKIIRLIKLMEDNLLDNIVFQFVKPVIKMDSDSIMDLTEMGEIVEYIFYAMKSTKIMYKIEVSFPLCLIDQQVLEKLIEEDKIVTCCHIQSGKGIIFDCDFQVLPCNHFVDMPFIEKQIKSREEIEILWDSEEKQGHILAKSVKLAANGICAVVDVLLDGCF